MGKTASAVALLVALAVALSFSQEREAERWILGKTNHERNVETAYSTE